MNNEYLFPSNAEYHAWDAIGSSMLRTYRESPRLYYETYVIKTRPPKRSDSLALGSLLHLAMQYPEDWRDRVWEFESYTELLDEPYSARKKAHREARAAAEAVAVADGFVIASRADVEAVTGMVCSIMSHPEASAMIGDAKYREAAVRWIDEETGLECKAMADGLIPSDYTDTVYAVYDFKTSAKWRPAEFAHEARKYQLHCQAAWYVDAFHAQAHRLIVVHNEYPFETVVYNLDHADILNGRHRNRAALLGIKRSLETNCWDHPWMGLQHLQL